MFISSPLFSRASTIGWIGLGAMGHPMAINLFTKTFLAHTSSSNGAQSPGSLQHYDSVPQFVICETDDKKASRFIADLESKVGSAGNNIKVKRASNAREVVEVASKVFTMLPSTPQVEHVYLDEKEGVIAALRDLSKDLNPSLSGSSTVKSISSTTGSTSNSPALSGLGSGIHTLLVDQTTLDPTAARKVSQLVMEAGNGRATMLDAPVSGGITAAAAGELTIMFGSPSKEATELAVPLLQRMAREGGVVSCGLSGSGVGVKVCNNLILAINQIALAEGLALGRSLGIDPLLLHSVVNTSSGQSWSSRVNSPLAEVPNSPGSRSYNGGFQSRLMLKDVGLALHAAHACDLPTPLTWAAQSIYEAVCSEDGGEWATKDFSVVYEWLRKKQREGVEKGWKDDEGATERKS